MPMSRERWASRRARASDTSGSNQVRRFESPEPRRGRAVPRQGRVDRSRIGPAELPPRGLPQKAASGRAALTGRPAQPGRWERRPSPSAFAGGARTSAPAQSSSSVARRSAADRAIGRDHSRAKYCSGAKGAYRNRTGVTALQAACYAISLHSVSSPHGPVRGPVLPEFARRGVSISPLNGLPRGRGLPRLRPTSGRKSSDLIALVFDPLDNRVDQDRRCGDFFLDHGPSRVPEIQPVLESTEGLRILGCFLERRRMRAA